MKPITYGSDNSILYLQYHSLLVENSWAFTSTFFLQACFHLWLPSVILFHKWSAWARRKARHWGHRHPDLSHSHTYSRSFQRPHRCLVHLYAIWNNRPLLETGLKINTSALSIIEKDPQTWRWDILWISQNENTSYLL